MKQIIFGFAHLSELIEFMMEYLETAPLEVVTATARALHVLPRDDLFAIKEALKDPHLDGKKIAALGSKLLELPISYQKDSVVYIADPSDAEDCSERATAELLARAEASATRLSSVNARWAKR
ncbi:hypothetical protein [Rhizobium sp. GCM10022189]|uniref:hypothetical protein n=1 Tax=Rhizobium sp. GCM10022189 TaxID=3252654 RepID=UPI00361B10EB